MEKAVAAGYSGDDVSALINFAKASYLDPVCNISCPCRRNGITDQPHVLVYVNRTFATLC